MQSSEPSLVGHLQNAVMPTLQQMHKNTAASPRSTAKLFLLLEELSYRHLYRLDHAHLGTFKLASATGFLDREDDLASNGFCGVAGLTAALLKCLEAQARGFAHGHGKTHSVPNGTKELYDSLDNVVQEINKLKKRSSDEHPDEEISRIVAAEMQSYNERLIASASTRQYQSATLLARQMGQLVRDAPFSDKQQRQSRYDGAFEEDGLTQRRVGHSSRGAARAHNV